MELYFCFMLTTVLLYSHTVFSITTDYLNLVCNVTSKSLETSLRVEASTSLTYTANTDCYYNVVTDINKKVFLVIRTFVLESEVNGQCVDYVNVHDGTDVNAATLNSSPLCGTHRNASLYTSTGNEMTIYFHSDSTGQYQGFELIFSAVSTGVCSSSQTACVNTSVCIDSTLRCNTIDECGDNTDEDGCVYPGTNGVQLHPYYILIICMVVSGIFVVTSCIVIGHLVWRHNKWRWYMSKPITADKLDLQPITYDSTYPVTKVYYKDKFQSLYKDVDAHQQSDSYSYHTESFRESENTEQSLSL